VHAEHLGLVPVEVDEQLLGCWPGNVVLTPCSSGRCRVLVRKCLERLVGGARVRRNAILHVESKPPVVPRPGIDGGFRAKATPSRRKKNWPFSRLSASNDDILGSLALVERLISPNMTPALLFCWPR